MRRKSKRLYIRRILAALWLLGFLSACGRQIPPETAGTLPALTVPASQDSPSSGLIPSSADSAGEGESSREAEATLSVAPQTSQLPSESVETMPSLTASSKRPSRPRPDRTAPPTEVPEAEDIESSTEKYFSLAPDYSRPEDWAYLALGEDKAVDVFLLAPTVVEQGIHLHIEDAEARKLFLTSLDKQKGLYESRGCLYAPYYRQMAEEVYGWNRPDQQRWRDLAYRDAAAAFRAFLDYYDRGKPLILAGFSQGSELSLRLMQEFFDPATAEGRQLLGRLVAVYAIGAGLPESMVAQYPWLKPAEERRDTGVIISFDCELPGITHSVLLPAGSRSLSINPLSWSRSGAYADRSLNKGAFFPGIGVEEAQLCGCYIEPERGALIVTDINPAYFPVDSAVLPEGNLHEYDYQFFFRNIQENVTERIDAFFWGP